jgi:predicted heme/steroid binding protein/uncharacterized membrane protein
MAKYVILLVSLFSLLLCVVPRSFATPEYARETGFACGKCHIDTAGGGPLTQTGERYLADLKMKGLYRPFTTLKQMERVVIGYIHLLTAICWFGTILYVHILLKPAYAAKGLPKGELVLGWLSIGILAVTGTLLTIARMPTWKAFYTTRFGLLLSIKICLFLIMAASAAVVTFYLRPKMKRKMKQLRTERDDKGQDFSIEELQTFNGRDGAPAYIAYNGSVYDVTESRLWKGGAHLKKHSAGADLTEILKTAPHGEEKLLAFKKIGKVRPAAGEPRPFHERLFYFLAYMNLALVFLIVFVIALMRWG